MKRLIATLLLLAAPAWAALDFDGSNDFASIDSSEVTGTPVTICCWVQPETVSGITTIFSLVASSGGHYHSIRGDTDNDRVDARTSTGSPGAASTTGSVLTSNAWHHACGVFASSTSRTAYVDGGNSATNTDSITPNTIDRTKMGAFTTDNIVWNGDLAECGLWNIALSAENVATLADGFAPPCVRRDALLAYWPIVRETTTARDLFTGMQSNLAITEAVVDAHPRVVSCQ